MNQRNTQTQKKSVIPKIVLCPEEEDTLRHCLGEIDVIRYIIAPWKKELDVGTDTHLDPAIPLAIQDNAVTRKVNVTEKSFDLQIFCPVCGKTIATWTGFSSDWKIFSGPIYCLLSIPFNEIPKEAIVYSTVDTSKNPSIAQFDKWLQQNATG